MPQVPAKLRAHGGRGGGVFLGADLHRSLMRRTSPKRCSEKFAWPRYYAPRLLLAELSRLGDRQSDEPPVPSCFPSKHTMRTGNTRPSGTFVLCEGIAQSTTISLSVRPELPPHPPSEERRPGFSGVLWPHRPGPGGGKEESAWRRSCSPTSTTIWTSQTPT